MDPEILSVVQFYQLISLYLKVQRSVTTFLGFFHSIQISFENLLVIAFIIVVTKINS